MLLAIVKNLVAEAWLMVNKRTNTMEEVFILRQEEMLKSVIFSPIVLKLLTAGLTNGHCLGVSTTHTSLPLRWHQGWILPIHSPLHYSVGTRDGYCQNY
jgi:hypothetical protein